VGGEDIWKGEAAIIGHGSVGKKPSSIAGAVLLDCRNVDDLTSRGLASMYVMARDD